MAHITLEPHQERFIKPSNVLPISFHKEYIIKSCFLGIPHGFLDSIAYVDKATLQKRTFKTLPEAQWTQGIESIT